MTVRELDLPTRNSGAFYSDMSTERKSRTRAKAHMRVIRVVWLIVGFGCLDCVGFNLASEPML